MAMGKKPAARQPSPMWVTTADLPTNAGHPFFERLNRVLDEAGFDAFVEGPLKPGSSAGMVGTVIATATLTVGILRLIG